MGEFCPMLNDTSKALVGAINGSVITQDKTYMALPSASMNMGRSMRAIIPSITTPSITDTVFAMRYKKSSKAENPLKKMGTHT